MPDRSRCAYHCSTRRRQLSYHRCQSAKQRSAHRSMLASCHLVSSRLDIHFHHFATHHLCDTHSNLSRSTARLLSISDGPEWLRFVPASRGLPDLHHWPALRPSTHIRNHVPQPGRDHRRHHGLRRGDVSHRRRPLRRSTGYHNRHTQRTHHINDICCSHIWHDHPSCPPILRSHPPQSLHQHLWHWSRRSAFASQRLPGRAPALAQHCWSSYRCDLSLGQRYHLEHYRNIHHCLPLRRCERRYRRRRRLPSSIKQYGTHTLNRNNTHQHDRIAHCNSNRQRKLPGGPTYSLQRFIDHRRSWTYCSATIVSGSIVAGLDCGWAAE